MILSRNRIDREKFTLKIPEMDRMGIFGVNFFVYGKSPAWSEMGQGKSHVRSGMEQKMQTKTVPNDFGTVVAQGIFEY